MPIIVSHFYFFELDPSKFPELHFFKKLSNSSSSGSELRASTFMPVDNKSTGFALFTQVIDKFFTDKPLVDNFYTHNVTVVDKLRKTIAPIAII
ncbi:hypothetical protein [Neobacillus vireti]|uniref:Uncharacterized protein n=1 Tax=Neobacillus vireti LMG 21834 TaxID=1131730 RepID=A0AB94IG41_9BACI|nr:hypothetical protein [Neobacillus vireti]ETI66079.1 hypothetical protein BAVI_24428 [Neobacillus vireti LMG 21834]KLT16788.1 hypothetical protein AA980_17345 [Neobacillus vireti]